MVAVADRAQSRRLSFYVAQTRMPSRYASIWLAAKVGVERRLDELRHGVATNMLADGVDVATVARRLGHATPRVTLRVMPTPPRKRTARLRV